MNDIFELTPREAKVLDLLAEGQPTSLIARRMDLAHSTIKNDVTKIKDKLEIEGTVRDYAVQQRIRELELKISRLEKENKQLFDRVQKYEKKILEKAKI